MSLWMIFSIIGLHFLGDFILQSHWMAVNKSKRWDALGVHCIIYGATLIPIGIMFAASNGIAHFVVDAVTSRITASLWVRQQWHWFFVVVGADQLIHYICLFGSYGWVAQSYRLLS